MSALPHTHEKPSFGQLGMGSTSFARCHGNLVRYFLAVGANGTARVCGFFGEYNPTAGVGFSNFGSSTGTTVRLSSVGVYNGVCVATGDNGTVITAASYNGPWSRLNLPTQKQLNASGFGLNSFFIAGEDETIF